MQNPLHNPQVLEAFTHASKFMFNRSGCFHIIREHGEHRHRHQILDELEDDLIHWFYSEGEVYPDEIEAHILSVLADQLHTELEEGTALEMGRLLHNMYVRCREGDLSFLEEIQKVDTGSDSLALREGRDTDTVHVAGSETQNLEPNPTPEVCHESNLCDSNTPMTRKPRSRARRHQPDAHGWHTAGRF